VSAQSDPNYVAPFSSFQGSIWTYLGRAQYQSGKLADAKRSLERALSQMPNDAVAKLYLGLTNVRLQTTEKATNPLPCRTFLLRSANGLKPKRVAALARERGVAFDLTAESDGQLRKAGADDLLLDEIKKIRAEAAKRRKTDEAGQAKELTSALRSIRDHLDFLNNTRPEMAWDPNQQIRAQIQTGLSLLSTPQPGWQKVLSTEFPLQQALESVDFSGAPPRLQRTSPAAVFQLVIPSRRSVAVLRRNPWSRPNR
jgi:tetratricopeptide (TPR) repeat protein